MNTIELSVNINDEVIDDIIEGAGYEIGYWASKAVYDSEAQTYEVTEEEDEKRYFLTYPIIAKAITSLVKGDITISPSIREAITLDLVSKEGCHMDGECYDVIIQVACFGDVIYG